MRALARRFGGAPDVAAASSPPRPGVRLLFVVILLSLVLSTMGVILAWRNERAERRRQITQTSLLARAAAAETERFISDQLDIVQSLAVAPAVRNHDVDTLRSYFEDVRARQPRFVQILWANPSGMVEAGVLANPPGPPINLTDREYFRTVLANRQPVVSAATIGRFSNMPVIILAAPTFGADGTTLTGVLAAGITLSQLEKTLLEFRVGDTGTLLVVDSAGQLIVDPGRPTQIVDVSNTPLVQRARSGGGVTTDLPNLRGAGGRLIGFEAVPTANWLVFVDRATSEALAPARRTFAQALVALLGLTAAGIAGAAWMGFRLDRLAAAQHRALVESEALARENAQLYEREQAARAEAEAGQQRLAFLAQASAVLASSLDYETTLRQVADSAVPALADWCTVHIQEADGQVRRTALAAVDPATESLLHELRSRYPFEVASTHPVAKAIQHATSSLQSYTSDEFFSEFAHDESHREALHQIMSSYMCVPLIARGQTLGAMAFALRSRDQHYTEADLRLAEDLAHRAAMAIDSARLYDGAQNALRVRDDFLASISHDLRTPLTTIKAFAQQLRKHILTRTVPEHGMIVEGLTTIDGSATRMARLIEQVLDLSHIGSDTPLSLERRPVDLVELVRSEVDQLHAATDRDHIRVETTAGELVAPCEPERMRRVIANLLSNAAKYSPNGGEILVRVATGDGPGDAGYGALVTVRDEGIGIPAADLPHVFERFHRGANVARISGTGIGLAGAQQIVEQHAGRILVESEEGKGTCVTVWLPLE